MTTVDPSFGPIESVSESEDILAFYRDEPERTLKTLVCRAYFPASKEYIALVTRGDRSADFDKLKQALSLKNIRLANPDEMKKLGLVVGYVSPLDCTELKVVVDPAVEEFDAYFDGANREAEYRKNVNYPRDFTAWKVLDFAR